MFDELNDRESFVLISTLLSNFCSGTPNCNILKDRPVDSSRLMAKASTLCSSDPELCALLCKYFDCEHLLHTAPIVA